MPWNREQWQCFQSCLFIVNFENIWLIKEMLNTHYTEQQLMKACIWENQCCSFLALSFLRALRTRTTLGHNFIFCPVTHNLLYLAKKDLVCCKARAEMKERRNASLLPLTHTTLPLTWPEMLSSSLVGSNFPALRSQWKQPASQLTTAWPGWLRKMLGKRAVLPSSVCWDSFNYQARTFAGRHFQQKYKIVSSETGK